MGTAKRGKSLEERLREVRAAAAVPGRSEGPTGLPRAGLPRNRSGPRTSHPNPATSYNQNRSEAKRKSDRATLEHAVQGLSALEGDTLLPRASRVDVAAAAETAVRQSTSPDDDVSQDVAQAGESPVTQPASLLGDNWSGSSHSAGGDAGAAPGEIANEAALGVTTPASVNEPEETSQLSSLLLERWLGTPRIPRSEPREIDAVGFGETEDDSKVDERPIEYQEDRPARMLR
jgi:hypothetical protein